MTSISNLVFRASGGCLAVCAVVFMSVPAASSWKKTAGIACAIFGAITLVAMYFAKRVEHAEDIHLVNRELHHYPPDIGHHGD